MYPTKMHRRIISVLLSFVILASLTIGASAAYGPYDITFTGAVDATTRWGSPVTTGPSSYPTITSKWYEARTKGTSPHVGVDLGVGANYEVAAVTNGTLTKVSDGTTYNTHSLSTSKSGVYCHYEHMSSVSKTGYLRQGEAFAVPGDVGSPGSVHLHFGAYTENKMSGRRAYRNETLYRNVSQWGNGRYLDTFSVVGWTNGSIASVVLSFSESTNSHTEKPTVAQIYYRNEGDLTWLGPYDMKNTTEYTYSYDFSGKVPSGTTIEWLVRYRRASPSTYMFCPAKFYNPSSNPNTVGYSWDYVTSTVS